MLLKKYITNIKQYNKYKTINLGMWMKMVKNQINIIILVGIVIVLTATSGCISGDEDSNQASDTSYNSENTDSSLNTETQDQSSSQSSSSSNICPECNGAGTVECYNTVTGGTTCGGTGIVQGGGTEGSTCRVCGGSGTINCPTCGGSGTV
jgi:DnaJ-class molecular chaperone